MSAKSSEPEEPDSYKLQMKDKGLLSFLWISGGKQIFLWRHWQPTLSLHVLCLEVWTVCVW